MKKITKKEIKQIKWQVSQALTGLHPVYVDQVLSVIDVYYGWKLRQE